jgi:hypothetical protein
MQPASRLKHGGSGTKKEMVGIREYYPRIVEKEIPRFDGLDRGLGANGHEHRRLHVAVRKMQNAAPCLRTGIARDNFKPTYFILFQNACNYTTFHESKTAPSTFKIPHAGKSKKWDILAGRSDRFILREKADRRLWPPQ